MITHEIKNDDGSITILTADHDLHLKDRFSGTVRKPDGTEGSINREVVATVLATVSEADVVYLSGIPSRRDLGPEHGFDENDLGRDDNSLLLIWDNHYRCEDTGEEWISEWSCQCNDDCDCCGEIEPFKSEWRGPDDAILQAVCEALPELPLKPEMAPR